MSRILFVMRHSGFVRNFDTAIAELAGRGHTVHLGFELPREQAEAAEALAARFPGQVTFGPAPVRGDRWEHVAFDLRAGLDALRYRGAEYADAPKLRERGLRSAPPLLRALTAPAPLRTPAVLRAWDRALRRLLAAIPPDPGVERHLDEQAPDVLLVTPLVAGPTQDDVVRGARRRGIPVVLPVTSWDNLTNKGLIRERVDRVLVWNDAQREEAARLHGVAPDRVIATGAHTYDHWFAWTPSRDRAAFAAEVGLPADRPIVLYLCSSKFIAPREPEFVRRWLRSLREAAPEPLRGAGVLVRPHPATGAFWRDVDLSAHGPAVVWPPTGGDPRDAGARAAYFDSMFHAAAAVGINTSALIELAIVGRPAFTVLDPDFRETQEGTLHFSHLTGAGGGTLTVARDLAEHHTQLAAALADPAPPATREAFLRAFVRPHGLDVPAAPRFADAVEAARAGGPEPEGGPVDAALRALVLAPLTLTQRRSGRKRGAPWRRWTHAARRSKASRRARKRVLRAGRRLRARAGRALGR